MVYRDCCVALPRGAVGLCLWYFLIILTIFYSYDEAFCKTLNIRGINIWRFQRLTYWRRLIVAVPQLNGIGGGDINDNKFLLNITMDIKVVLFSLKTRRLSTFM